MVGLGGNTPGTLEALALARRWLEGLLDDPRGSSLYRTVPQIDVDQAPFWNAVVAGNWPGTAEGLLERLLMFEARVGRTRDPSRPKGPRVLDLDLIVFGTLVRASARLTVPHPGASVRQFVLVPLAEVDPLAVDPRDGSLWSTQLARLADQGVDRTGRTW